MSYDLRVWGRQPCDLDEVLAPKAGWSRGGEGFALERRRWQILVDGPRRLEPEDVPPQVSEALPGPSILFEVSLEPGSAPESARKTAVRTARALAAAVAGVVEDPQQETLAFARGGKRFLRPARKERSSTLELSWWYAGTPLRSVAGMRGLLSVLGRHIPEAVPRRYGPFEPPEYRTVETGLESLATYMFEQLDDIGPVYDCARPVVGFSIADSNMVPDSRFGFRANCFELSFEADVLQQPGWATAVRSLWRDLSMFLSPFYGDARVLEGNVWSGATLCVDSKTEEHPVRSWFWRGIPAEPGVAMVLGTPYSEIWTPCSATTIGGLHFVEPEDWAVLRPLSIEIPAELTQPARPGWGEWSSGAHIRIRYDEYPRCWPFD